MGEKKKKKERERKSDANHSAWAELQGVNHQYQTGFALQPCNSLCIQENIRLANRHQQNLLKESVCICLG